MRPRSRKGGGEPRRSAEIGGDRTAKPESVSGGAGSHAVGSCGCICHGSGGTSESAVARGGASEKGSGSEFSDGPRTRLSEPASTSPWRSGDTAVPDRSRLPTAAVAPEAAPAAVQTAPVSSTPVANSRSAASMPSTSKLDGPEEGAVPVVAPQSAARSKGTEKLGQGSRRGLSRAIGRQAGWFDPICGELGTARYAHSITISKLSESAALRKSSIIGWPSTSRPIHEMMRSAAQGHIA